MPKKSIRVLSLVLIIITVLVATIPLAAAPSCENQINDTRRKLLDCVTVEGVYEHLVAFQGIADANGGNRAAGTSGYDASVDYVVEKMTAAGYNVTIQDFPFTHFLPAPIEQTAPVVADHEAYFFEGSGSGSASAAVTAVDLNLVPPYDPVDSGCEAADFAGFPAGDIALIQRGTCTFAQKVQNAEAAGASAVILFNQGNSPDREGFIEGTTLPHVAGIPVIDATFATGMALAQPGTHVTVTAQLETITQHNIIAESRSGDPRNVVMAGAHLDSVPQGPGINDNGSGSAVLLEVAEQMAQLRPKNKVRFAWWGVEEPGLFGSDAYVQNLTQTERAGIAMYLNFDMVGSVNYVYFIYDGNNSDGGGGQGPKGSAEIEARFKRYFRSAGLRFASTAFDGRSDYLAFAEAGIPVGGLFTGAEETKTRRQAIRWGGTAGIALDPCYHLACDTIDNISMEALDVNADAAAYVILFYSKNVKEVVNALGPVPPATGPAAPFIRDDRAR